MNQDVVGARIVRVSDVQPALLDLPQTAPHPCPFRAVHIEVLMEAVAGYRRVLDSFAGTGGIHRLRRYGHDTVGVEIEPEWASQHPGTIVGSALDLPFPRWSFDALATSPTFGNRMADHHNARDASERHTYRHSLGRPLTSGNSGELQWGPKYRRFHEAAWAEGSRVIRPGGRLVLNIKDFPRRGEPVAVTAWHVQALGALGWREVVAWNFGASGLRHGANRDRVEIETVIAFERER